MFFFWKYKWLAGMETIVANAELYPSYYCYVK